MGYITPEHALCTAAPHSKSGVTVNPKLADRNQQDTLPHVRLMEWVWSYFVDTSNDLDTRNDAGHKSSERAGTVHAQPSKQVDGSSHWEGQEDEKSRKQQRTDEHQSAPSSSSSNPTDDVREVISKTGRWLRLLEGGHAMIDHIEVCSLCCRSHRLQLCHATGSSLSATEIACAAALASLVAFGKLAACTDIVTCQFILSSVRLAVKSSLVAQLVHTLHLHSGLPQVCSHCLRVAILYTKTNTSNSSHKSRFICIADKCLAYACVVLLHQENMRGTVSPHPWVQAQMTKATEQLSL